MILWVEGFPYIIYRAYIYIYSLKLCVAWIVLINRGAYTRVSLHISIQYFLCNAIYEKSNVFQVTAKRVIFYWSLTLKEQKHKYQLSKASNCPRIQCSGFRAFALNLHTEITGIGVYWDLEEQWSSTIYCTYMLNLKVTIFEYRQLAKVSWSRLPVYWSVCGTIYLLTFGITAELDWWDNTMLIRRRMHPFWGFCS